MASISTLFGKIEDNDNDDKKTIAVVKDVFRKLRIYLRIMGIYFDFCDLAKKPWPMKLVLGMSNVMSVFYLASVWFVQIRLVPIVIREEMFSTGFLQVSLLFFIYLSALWNFSCSVYLVRKNWTRFVRAFSSECTLQENQFPFLLRHFGKFLFALFIIGCSVPVFSVIGLFKPEDSSSPSEMTLFRLYPANPNTTFWFAMKCFYAYFAFISYQQVFAYCLFIITICYLLKREFQQVTHTLEKHYAHLHQMKPCLLEDLRQKHERLCDLTRTVDSVLGYLVFGIYFTGILNLCFCVSCFSSPVFPQSQIPTLISVMGAAASQMLVCMVIGVVLNREAHKPKDTLMKIRAGKLERDDFQSLTVFLSQVSGQDIGITALGLFTVNKSTILTVAGTVITYAVIVQQLNYGTEAVGTAGTSNMTGGIQ